MESGNGPALQLLHLLHVREFSAAQSLPAIAGIQYFCVAPSCGGGGSTSPRKPRSVIFIMSFHFSWHPSSQSPCLAVSLLPHSDGHFSFPALQQRSVSEIRSQPFPTVLPERAECYAIN
eukprot:Lithocolla_globosa_v1_NODE_2839_length_1853_cov_4.766407.p2 type:complete len:119 gc:universal NODE_2839_length_1853_cov_4.766407:508-152(-)